jgi:hypothetical protein
MVPKSFPTRSQYRLGPGFGLVIGFTPVPRPSSAASIDSELTEDDIAAIFKPEPTCRSLTPIDVDKLLKEFERNPEIAG